MFGLEWNLPSNTLSVTPHLPADWQYATVRNIPFGTARVDLKFMRSGSDLVVEAIHAPAGVRLASHTAGTHAEAATLHIPLPDVEAAVAIPVPEFGAESNQLKVIDQKIAAHSFALTLAGIGGETYKLQLRENAPNLHVHADGAMLGASSQGLRSAEVAFPPGAGYTDKTVVFSW